MNIDGMAGQTHQNDKKNRRAIALWLLVCCGMVFAMVIVGAITRLTESGLSITEWKPVTGALPPLNEAAWQAEFDLYKQSPEYQKKHFWMEIEDFKKIYFWEWFHRLLGRLIGVVYALPLVWFWARGRIPAGWKPALVGMLALGGAQGAMGWYMVKSGLVDIPAVSHFRLAAHLGLAFVIYSLLLWLALSLVSPREGFVSRETRRLLWHGGVTLAVIAVTICWGAFTAGLDARMIYNETFPKMGAVWIPPEAFSMQPVWINAFENIVTVQLVHRWLGMAAVLAVLLFWWHAARRGWRFYALHGFAVMAFLQAGLGIATLFSAPYAAGLAVAVLHQAGALLLLTLGIIAIHKMYRQAVNRPDLPA